MRKSCLLLSACLAALIFVAGCADGPYRITADDKIYYAKQIERGNGGRVKFTDAVTNAQMTLYDQPGVFPVKEEKMDSNQFDDAVSREKAQIKK